MSLGTACSGFWTTVRPSVARDRFEPTSCSRPLAWSRSTHAYSLSPSWLRVLPSYTQYRLHYRLWQIIPSFTFVEYRVQICTRFDTFRLDKEPDLIVGSSVVRGQNMGLMNSGIQLLIPISQQHFFPVLWLVFRNVGPFICKTKIGSEARETVTSVISLC